MDPTPETPKPDPKRLNAPYGAHVGGLFKNVACNSASATLKLEAAPLIYCRFCRFLKFELRGLHAIFYGARRISNASMVPVCNSRLSLNAPCGAR